MNVASSKVSIYGQHHREPCAAAVLCDVHIIAVTTRTFQTAFATHQKKGKNTKRRRKPSPFIVIIVKWLVVLACVRYKPREWSMKSLVAYTQQRKERKKKNEKNRRVTQSGANAGLEYGDEVRHHHQWIKQHKTRENDVIIAIEILPNSAETISIGNYNMKTKENPRPISIEQEETKISTYY